MGHGHQNGHPKLLCITAQNLPFHCLLLWDSCDWHIWQCIHLFSFTNLWKDASSGLSKAHKHEFVCKTNQISLWSYQVMQSLPDSTSILSEDSSRSIHVSLSVFKHTAGETTAVHRACCVRGWWLPDFPQRLLWAVGLRPQQMVILSWLWCGWAL